MTSVENEKLPQNETILEYINGSEERKSLVEALTKLSKEEIDIPIVIGAKEIRRKAYAQRQIMPFDHAKAVAKFHYCTKLDIQKAIENCLGVREGWERRSLSARSEIFLKAADLTATKYRADLNAAAILGQGKTIKQAEIDCCKLVDFIRYNVYYANHCEDMYSKTTSQCDMRNKTIFRGLEGFVAAITPFNSNSTAANMCSAPILMGNVVLWNPAPQAILSNYIVFQILREAGLPAGVLNFLPTKAGQFEDLITSNENLVGVNFGGSYLTFRQLWKQIGTNVELYKTFPRLVGCCGGKNFHFVHPSADIDMAVSSTIRAAFEYQGQKSSACSRLYVPDSLYEEIETKLLEHHKRITIGQPFDNNVIMSAVIDKQAFDRISSYINYAAGNHNMTIIAGGQCNFSKGYFIKPTIILCNDPNDKMFTEQIFGPILCVYSYPNKDCYEILNSIKSCTPYSLTGSIFTDHATFPAFTEKASDVLRESCGNFFINDKCTGSVVGRQPFGGAGLSGTNEKAGGPDYILKWTSPLTITEAVEPIRMTFRRNGFNEHF